VFLGKWQWYAFSAKWNVGLMCEKVTVTDNIFVCSFWFTV